MPKDDGEKTPKPSLNCHRENIDVEDWWRNPGPFSISETGHAPAFSQVPVFSIVNEGITYARVTSLEAQRGRDEKHRTRRLFFVDFELRSVFDRKMLRRRTPRCAAPP